MKKLKELLEEKYGVKLDEGKIGSALVTAMSSTVDSLKDSISKDDEKAIKRDLKSIEQIINSLKKNGLTEASLFDDYTFYTKMNVNDVSDSDITMSLDKGGSRNSNVTYELKKGEYTLQQSGSSNEFLLTIKGNKQSPFRVKVSPNKLVQSARLPKDTKQKDQLKKLLTK